MRAVLAFASALILAGPVAAQAEPTPPPAIAVTGEGSAAGAPDTAIVTSGVVTRAPTAGAALKANAAAMTKVLAAVRDARIPDRDVGTSGLAVQPQFDYPNDGSGTRAPKLAGYEVRNMVTIRSRDVDGLGELIDRLVQSGSNQIEGLTFDFADRDKKLDEARRDAVADARRKAALYAESAGVTLGPVLSIDEAATDDGPIRPFAARAKAMDAAAATPVARGEQELRAKVNMRWGLQP